MFEIHSFCSLLLVFRIICHCIFCCHCARDFAWILRRRDKDPIWYDSNSSSQELHCFLSPFLAKWQQTELLTKSTHVWCQADGRGKQPDRKDCQWTEASTFAQRGTSSKCLHSSYSFVFRAFSSFAVFFFYYSGSSPSGNKWQVKLMSLDLSSSFYIISKEKVKANLKLCSTSRERWT